MKRSAWGRIGPIALFLLISAPACKKMLAIALEDRSDASTTAAANTNTNTDDDDDPPPVKLPHVPPPPSSQPPDSPAAATAKAASAETFPATCAGSCEKTLKCMGAYSAPEQATCVAECNKKPPPAAKLAELNRKDCASLLSALKGGGGGGTSSGGSTAKKTAPAPNGCNADCFGCVWDGTSCYYLNGSMVGTGTVYCASCCCAKGGPAKRWD